MSETSHIRVSRGGLRVRAALVVVMLSSTLAPGCAQRTPSTLELTGSVADDTVTVTAPRIPAPTVDLEVGFAAVTAAEGTPTVQVPFADNGASASTEQAWMRVDRVDVKLGDIVTPGQVLVVVDDSLLSADVEQARAATDLARADIGAAGLRSREASEGLADIEKQRSEIGTQTAELQVQRADLQLQLDQARILVGTPVATGQPDPAEKVAQLEEALAEVDSALTELNDALIDLNEATFRLLEAQTSLQALATAMTAVANAKEVSARIAELRQRQAQIVAPVGGVVVDVIPLGTVVAPGAPLVEIRPSGANIVHTYVTAEQRELITLGTAARIEADSVRGIVLAGAVIQIGNEYEYVPTTFATKIIHLVRGLRVSIIVYGNRVPPAGTPVDVSIDTLAGTSP